MLFAHLGVCSVAGSCVGQAALQNAPVGAVLVSWVLTSLLFSLSAVAADVWLGRRSPYLLMGLMLPFFACLYSLAGTLVTFPAVRWGRKLIVSEG